MVAHRKEAQRKVFAAWLATPKPLRQPPTQKALAEQLGVSQDALSDWVQDDDVQGAVSAAMERLATDALATALSATVEIASDPANKNAVKAQELLFQMTGHYTPGRRLEGPGGGPVVIEYVSPVKRKDTETPQG